MVIIFRKIASQILSFIFQVKLDNFRLVQEGKLSSVATVMSTANQELAKKNRLVVKSLLHCMLLCVKRGFALRGHRDNGVPLLREGDEDDDDDSDSLVNLGNFKSIVQFGAEIGSQVLADHLGVHAKNATYLSGTAQADMLAVILSTLQKMVVDEAKDQAGKFVYAVSADEVTDASTTEQLAIVLRSVSKDGKVIERLLEYVAMESITGAEVSKAIVDCLERHGLSINDCRAQTYDGAGNMSGRMNGAQAHIKRLEPLADYHHCASHRLNLALNGTSNITEFRTLLNHITKLGIFMKYSPKRQNVFAKQLALADPPVAITKVSKLSNSI